MFLPQTVKKGLLHGRHGRLGTDNCHGLPPLPPQCPLPLENHLLVSLYF